VRGTVLRDPSERILSTGQRLVSLDVSVDYDDRPSENLEVVWLDPPKNTLVPRKGFDVFVVGRVRRRFFNTGGGVVSRQEVVAETVLTARQKSRINHALAEVAATVSAG
ncbi:MAG: single-strand DNA-binding protein, partial [Actinomycetota bacterium]